MNSYAIALALLVVVLSSPGASAAPASRSDTATTNVAVRPPESPAADSVLMPLAESLTGDAKAEYAAARILYEDGDFAGAVTKLVTAHRLSADPRLLWNIAAAEKNQRHYAKVIGYVQQFLAAGAPYVNEDDRAQAEQLLSAVRGFVSAVSFDVRPAGATIEVDGQSVGTSPLDGQINVDFGRHELRLSKPGYRSDTRTLELEGGKPTRIAVALVEESHLGTLKIFTDPNTTIHVDGKVAGVGMWQSTVPSGTHTVYLEGDKKLPQTSEIVVADGEIRSVNVLLQDASERKQAGLSPWLWVAGGVVATAGIVAVGYFALHDSSERPPIQKGTWNTLEF